MHSQRYFQNTLPDYVPGYPVVIPRDQILECAISVAEHIMRALTPVPRSHTEKKVTGGVYTGLAGIAYALWYAQSSKSFDANFSKKCLDHATSYLDMTQKLFSANADTLSQAALMVGDLGVQLVYAELWRYQRPVESEAAIRRVAATQRILSPLNFHRYGSDEYFVGRAGYLAAIQWVRKHFQIEIISEDAIKEICFNMITSGDNYAKEQKSQWPLLYAYYGEQYLGAAHGVCSIIQMLLGEKCILLNQDWCNRVKRTLDCLLSIQSPNGNFEPTVAEVISRRSSQSELVHWCHGAPDDRYLQACLKMGEIVWQKGLLKKGPGLCHGIAGNGYVFILLYRLTGNEKHLHRALQFAMFMFTEEFRKGARTPDEPYSLYEGWAGALLFLIDLLNPSQATFPFFDVF